jgi:hypothetical protein
MPKVNTNKILKKTADYTGYGKFTYPGGLVYEGQWKQGKFHGRGKATFPSGDVYDGEWKNNTRDGQGMYTLKSGTVYKALFKDDKLNGKGKMTTSSGDVYDGDWKDNKMDGYGKIFYNGISDFYEGEVENGLPNGQGKYVWDNGVIYEGEWKNGKRVGDGKATYPNGDVYRTKDGFEAEEAQTLGRTVEEIEQELSNSKALLENLEEDGSPENCLEEVRKDITRLLEDLAKAKLSRDVLDDQAKIQEQNIDHVKDCLAELLKSEKSCCVLVFGGYRIKFTLTKDKVFEAQAASNVCETKEFNVPYRGGNLNNIAYTLYMSCVKAINPNCN